MTQEALFAQLVERLICTQMVGGSNPSQGSGILTITHTNMRILFFDTETTGLPRNYNAPLDDFENWPRLVQIAWIEAPDPVEQRGQVKTFDTIIKPDGWDVPEEASKVHGITTERAALEGMPIKNALSMFSIALAQADMVIGHNVSFDRNIVGSEMLRAGFENSLKDKPRLCTMIYGTHFCNIPGNRGPKWPKLTELYQKLFSETMPSAHNAKADVWATAKCFYEMRKRNIITAEHMQFCLNNLKAVKPTMEGF